MSLSLIVRMSAFAQNLHVYVLRFINLTLLNILVVLHKEPRLSEMPQDMRTFVKLVTHVKSGDEELEEKLR